MSQQPLMPDQGLDLIGLFSLMWKSRWLIVITTILFGIVAAIYSLMATEWYRTDVVMVPVDRRSSQSGLGQLSGLANLAGISIGQGGNQEAIAVLGSKSYAREFITKYKLAPVLLAEGETSDDSKSDIREAVRIFEKLVRTVEFDRKTGLVTLTMRWTDPNTVARWANDYVQGVNDRMRLQALRESERNVSYLNKEMSATTVVSMQQSLGRVLESEMQKLMLARGNVEFAFKVVDPGYPPDRRFSPQRTLTVLIAMFLGGLCSVLFVFARNALLARRAPENSHV